MAKIDVSRMNVNELEQGGGLVIKWVWEVEPFLASGWSRSVKIKWNLLKHMGSRSGNGLVFGFVQAMKM